MNDLIIFVIGFLASFISFFFIRIMFGVLAKDMFYKYFIIDSLIYALNFNISGFFGNNSENKTIGGPDEAIFFLLFIVIIPVIYNTIKGYFIIKKHPRLKNEYYPLIEFVVFIFGNVVGYFLFNLLRLAIGIN